MKTTGSWPTPLIGTQARILSVEFNLSDTSEVPRQKGSGVTPLVHVVRSLESKPGFIS